MSDQIDVHYQELVRVLHIQPEIADDPYSFLDVMGMSNSETAISNLYAYFFDPIKSPELGHVFLDALNSLLEDDLIMTNFIVHREYPSSEGGRIDLVIEEDTEEANKRVIIIENKIYHTVENNLDDYIRTFSGHNVTSVLLALEKIDVHRQFYPITHRELIEAVSYRLGPVIDKVPSKYLVLLQDFIYHIKYFDSKMDDKAYQFVFEQGANITKINDLLDGVFDDLTRQISKTATTLFWAHNRTSGWSHSIKNKTGSYLLYFQLENIFSKREFRTDLYVAGKRNREKWKAKDYDKSTKNKATKLGIDLVPEWVEGMQTMTAQKTYEISSMAELKNFDQFVVSIMANDWLPMTDALSSDFGFK